MYKFKAITRNYEFNLEWIGFAKGDKPSKRAYTLPEAEQNACIMDFINKHKDYFESVLKMIQGEIDGFAYSPSVMDEFRPVFLEDLIVFIEVS